jgi:hypothetical protein
MQKIMKIKTNIHAGAGTRKPTKTSIIVFNPFITAARCAGT